MMNKKLCCSFLLLFLLCIDLFGNEKFSAIVVSVNGARKIEKLKNGDFVYPDTIINLKIGEEVKLLLRNGNIVKITGPYKGLILSFSGGRKWFSSDVGDFLKTNLSFYSIDLLRNMGKTKKGFMQVYPFNSYILKMPVLFKWKSDLKIKKFRVHIFREGIIKKSSKHIAELKINNKKKLYDKRKYQENHPYSWYVIGYDGRKWVNTEKTYFQIIDTKSRNRIVEKLKLLKSMKRDNKEDIVPYIIGAILLMKEKLYHMALKEVSDAINKNKLSPFPYTLRGRIYEEMNLKSLAASDYILSKKYGYR